jgi:polyisoprenoid-binding protein YceI
VTPLTVVDKQVIHRNANKALDVERYPEVTFTSTEVVMTEGTLDIAGDLTIHGVTEPLDTTLTLADGRATGSITVTQTDFGIKPYSAMLGQLKVSDDVTVELDIALPQV